MKFLLPAAVAAVTTIEADVNYRVYSQTDAPTPCSGNKIIGDKVDFSCCMSAEEVPSMYFQIKPGPRDCNMFFSPVSWTCIGTVPYVEVPAVHGQSDDCNTTTVNGTAAQLECSFVTTTAENAENTTWFVIPDANACIETEEALEQAVQGWGCPDVLKNRASAPAGRWFTTATASAVDACKNKTAGDALPMSCCNDADTFEYSAGPTTGVSTESVVENQTYYEIFECTESNGKGAVSYQDCGFTACNATTAADAMQIETAKCVYSAPVNDKEWYVIFDYSTCQPDSALLSLNCISGAPTEAPTKAPSEADFSSASSVGVGVAVFAAAFLL